MPANTLILLAASLGATPAAPTCTPPTYAQASPPKYPPSAVAERLEGTAVLRMLVGADGTVKELGFERSTGHVVLDDAVISAAGRWTFNPARCDGKPVENWTLVPFRFDLDSLTPEEIAAAGPAPQASSNPAAAPLIFPRVRQLQHVVELDTQPMEFSTFAEGEKTLAGMGLDKHESHGITMYFGGKDTSRVWIVHRATFTSNKAIVRLRTTSERDWKAMHRFAVLCEGSDTWCRQLRDDTEADLRAKPPPMPPLPLPSR